MSKDNLANVALKIAAVSKTAAPAWASGLESLSPHAKKMAVGAGVGSALGYATHDPYLDNGQSQAIKGALGGAAMGLAVGRHLAVKQRVADLEQRMSGMAANHASTVEDLMSQKNHWKQTAEDLHDYAKHLEDMKFPGK